jgi:hypothetical protein
MTKYSITDSIKNNSSPIPLDVKRPFPIKKKPMENDLGIFVANSKIFCNFLTKCDLTSPTKTPTN